MNDMRTRRHSVPHFCRRCGECACPCKECAVYRPCCGDCCWKPTAPRPPVKSTHNCTCAPKGLTA